MAKLYCCLSSCVNYNNSANEIDCIKHYGNVLNDAFNQILLHYEAMKKITEAITNERDVLLQKNETSNCSKDIDCCLQSLRINSKGSDDDILHDVENIQQINHVPSECSPKKQLQKASDRLAKEVDPSRGKENSPNKKLKKFEVHPTISKKLALKKLDSTKSKTVKNWMLAQASKFSSPNRLKQSKLPFKKTPVKRNESFFDDDMTFCAEAEKIARNAEPEPNRQCQIDGPQTFSTPTKVHQSQVLTSNQPSNVFIKQEQDTFIHPTSPEIFSDASNSSVLFIEPNEKEVFTIPDTCYLSPLKTSIKTDVRFFESQADENDEHTRESFEFTQREVYDGECDVCAMYYDEFAEKNGAFCANEELRFCIKNCQGYQKRYEKFKNINKPKGKVVIQCNKRIRRMDQYPNDTPSGFWDLNMTPRRKNQS